MAEAPKLPKGLERAIEALERAVEAHELEKRPEFAVQTEFHLDEARDELRAEIASELDSRYIELAQRAERDSLARIHAENYARRVKERLEALRHAVVGFWGTEGTLKALARPTPEQLALVREMSLAHATVWHPEAPPPTESPAEQPHNTGQLSQGVEENLLYFHGAVYRFGLGGGGSVLEAQEVMRLKSELRTEIHKMLDAAVAEGERREAAMEERALRAEKALAEIARQDVGEAYKAMAEQP